MNQKIIIGIVAIIIILAGVSIYSSNSSKSEMMEKEALMQKEKDAMMQKEEGTMVKDDNAIMAKAGSYESYEASKIAMASATHDIVLFFRASWCPTCIAVDKDIKANLNEIPSSLTILDVNYDNSTELKKKYGVTYQHTFVQVDAQGNLIKKWSGSPTLASLVSEVK
ncbi:MAG: thioredoxin family protein [Candidatus Paceibacterota bacterium]